jgi:hypothetical protein
MKKVLLLFMAIVISFLFSCKKENETTNQVSTLASPQNKTQVSNYRWLCISWNIDHTEFIYFCDGSGGNCLPDVVVTPKNSQRVAGFIKAFETNQLNKWFGEKENWSELFPDLEKENETLYQLQNEAVYWYFLKGQDSDHNVYVAVSEPVEDPDKADFSKVSSIISVTFSSKE